MAIVDLLFPAARGSMIGTLRLDVLIQESVEFPSIVTEYAVEDDGKPISDGILPQAQKISISGGVSGTSAVLFGGALSGGGQTGKSRLIDAMSTLQAIYAKRVPVTVVTGTSVYKDLGMSSCKVSRGAGGKGGNWLDIQCEFIHIRKVKLQTAAIPADPVAHGGATRQSAGKIQPTEPTPAQEGMADSWAYSATGFNDPKPGASRPFHDG